MKDGRVAILPESSNPFEIKKTLPTYIEKTLYDVIV